ncbi:MAG: tetratricopeptide repeat protein [Candidatus Hodarchaeales archaeon]
MSRSEIENLCKYAEDMIEHAIENPQMEEKLLNLAESHLSNLLEQYKVECIDTETGYIYSRLGMVKVTKNKLEEAEKCFTEALANLIVRGEFCQDRALSHWQLGKVYAKLEKNDQAKENFIRAIHIYDSLAMYEKLHLLEPDFKELGLKIEDHLPAKEFSDDGKPLKCRECGHNEFNLIEEVEDRWTYECTKCQCRNVVLQEMIASFQTQ